MDDYSNVNKASLINSTGLKYYDFVKTLKPKYTIVWLHIFIGHCATIAISFAVIQIAANIPSLIPLVIALGGLLLGYVFAYIMLFFHEASHYNLAPDRNLNDLLANIFVGGLFGQHIKDYRPVHFGHHKYHGETNDPEHAYFDPLNIQFFVESLLGIKGLGVLFDRKKSLGTLESDRSVYDSVPNIIIALVVNAAILIVPFALGHWYFSLTWIIGIVVFLPFFAALRPLLEHRDEKASKTTNYFKVPHGIINRLFGDGPVASTLGGAGFNRHLLHHFEPQISYTRLKEFEEYLADTDMASEVKDHQTTYLDTFLKLLEL